MTDRPETMEQWRTTLSETIDRLESITREQFFDEDALQYDPLCTAVGLIAGMPFEKDIEAWKTFMSSTGNLMLPLEPTKIADLTPTEIYYRLSEHVASERFVDGILVDPFESGSLVAALEKILLNLDSFTLSKI